MQPIKIARLHSYRKAASVTKLPIVDNAEWILFREAQAPRHTSTQQLQLSNYLKLVKQQRGVVHVVGLAAVRCAVVTIQGAKLNGQVARVVDQIFPGHIRY